MNIFIRVEFCIDDQMAWHCIEHLLNARKRVSKGSVIECCKIYLAREGGLFETEPQFDTTLETRQVDFETTDEVFNKIWK